jgi:hypothetical protein
MRKKLILITAVSLVICISISVQSRNDSFNEKITGESFSQWTEKNIFKPLGMTNSQFYKDCTEIVKKRAYPYWIPGDDNKIIKGNIKFTRNKNGEITGFRITSGRVRNLKFQKF